MSGLFNFILDQGDQFRRARLPSLYSDFALQRHSNPDGFVANIAAWMAVLGTAARAGALPNDGGPVHDVLSLRTGEPLLRALESKEWGRPLALGTVIDESISHRQMVPYQEFIKAPKNIYTRAWTVQPWWLLSWGLTQLGVVGPPSSSGTLPSEQFVIMSNVEQAGNEVLARMAATDSKIELIYPMKMFREKAANIMGLKGQMTDNDLAILLTSLARDKGAVVFDSDTVKFKASGESLTALTSQDKTIASLKVLIADMNVQIELLSIRIAELTVAAQRAIGKKNRTSAIAALKSKKLSEATCVQRTGTLAQLEEVFHNIEQATDQVAIVKVMEASATVLRNLRAETGGVEKVENIVDDIRDEISKVDDIGSVIQGAGQGSTTIDEDAVDEELEQMMQEAKAKAEEEDAQRTQRRLAEIEVRRDAKTKHAADAERDAKRTTSRSSQPTKTEQDPVDIDVDAIKRLSLDENPARPDENSTSRKLLADPAADA